MCGGGKTCVLLSNKPWKITLVGNVEGSVTQDIYTAALADFTTGTVMGLSTRERKSRSI